MSRCGSPTSSAPSPLLFVPLAAAILVLMVSTDGRARITLAGVVGLLALGSWSPVCAAGRRAADRLAVTHPGWQSSTDARVPRSRQERTGMSG